MRAGLGGGRHSTLAPNLWMTGIKGDVIASPHWTIGVGAGWRYMDLDYDNDSEGLEFRQFELAYNGPRVWFAYSW